MADTGGAVDDGAPKVFVNYRRDDTAPYAGRLYDRLAEAFGDANIFMDVDSISFGLDFTEVIGNAVESCDVLLAVIGPDWLSTADRPRPRLFDQDDFVRLEIEAALERKVRVVPILVEGTELPGTDDIPPSLAPLLRRHVLRLTHEQFRIETQRLIDEIRRLSPAAGAGTETAAVAPSPPSATTPASGSAPTTDPSSTPAASGPASGGSEALPETTPASAAAPASADAVKILIIEPRLLRITIDLERTHTIAVDNTKFFGTVHVDEQQIAKKVGLAGTYQFTLDEPAGPVEGVITFEVATWSNDLKDVTIVVGDDVVYRN